MPKSRTRRSRPADGIAVQADRARKPLSAQHERAVPGQGAERPVAEGRAAGMARPPQGGAGPPLEAPAGRDRAAAGNPRRLSDRLSQHRRGDPHHPRGGRAQAGDDARASVLTDMQAEAILNMRLRALRKLEEFEIRKEFDALSTEKKQIEALLASDAKQWKTITLGGRARSARSSARTPSSASAAPASPTRPSMTIADIHHAMIEKEPVTVVVSEKGWLRAMKGHLDRSLDADLQGRRQPEARLPRPDHRQDPGVHHRRQVLHDRRRPAAGRARPWRADPHHGRHGERPGHRHRLRARCRRASCCSPRMTATASSCPRTRWSPTPARASR